nr:hypothetical protein [Tanacetum cinerariifolium]
MGYEHLSTIPKTESDKVIESSANNLVPIPSEYEDTSDNESECDVPIKDESSSVFTTFLNHIFDENDDFTSSDDESLFNLQIINKELAEYNNSLSWDRLTFFNDNEDHYVQHKEYLENSSKEIAASNSNQEKEKPPQDSNIRQLIKEECCIKICRKQKQNMENTMLELVDICRQKEFYCMHNNVDDLIESDLNSKLLLINLESQRLDKK